MSRQTPGWTPPTPSTRASSGWPRGRWPSSWAKHTLAAWPQYFPSFPTRYLPGCSGPHLGGCFAIGKVYGAAEIVLFCHINTQGADSTVLVDQSSCSASTEQGVKPMPQKIFVAA